MNHPFGMNLHFRPGLTAVILAAALGFGGFAAGPAMAQGVPSQAIGARGIGAATPPVLSQRATAPGLSAVMRGPHPLFTIGGFNGVVDAPVAAPDSSVAYRTFEGQPMTGADAILAGAQGAAQ
jgi:hypothetical protein